MHNHSALLHFWLNDRKGIWPVHKSWHQQSLQGPGLNWDYLWKKRPVKQNKKVWWEYLVCE